MYFALKSVKFDREYSKGEKIPKEAIASNMVEKLVRCGVIQEVEEVKEPSQKEVEEKTKVNRQPKKV